MNILLVNPPCRAAVVLPLGLGYIAGVLRNAGHKITMLDLNAKNMEEDAVGKLLEADGYDIIGIGGLTTTYNFVKKFSALAKKASPSSRIIAGNMISTAHPELLLKNSDVDICVIDEGEDTITELAGMIGDYPRLEKVDGISYKDGGRIIRTKERRRIEDLDRLPYPAWDLFDMDLYLKRPIHSEHGRKSINLSTVRGCPFQCVYCSRPFGSRVHRRSVESVIFEIGELKKRYKVQFVAFSDDLFISDKKWVMRFCDALISRRLGIGWAASARVNLVDMDLLKRMRAAGCESLGYGFESGSQKILDTMKKGVSVRQAEEAVRFTRRAGIKIEGSFMIGMPGETEETVMETVDFARRMELGIYRFFFTTPYPATPLYETAKEMGRIPADEDAYVGSLGEMYTTLIVNLTDMSDDSLKALKARAEEMIRASFGFRVRSEIFGDEARRIAASIRQRIIADGPAATCGWAMGKVIERLRN